MRCFPMIMLFGVMAFVASRTSNAQDPSLTIRVESRRVLVPVRWGHVPIVCVGSDRNDTNKDRCSWDGEVFYRSHRSVVDKDSPFSLGLIPPASIRLFEDGKQQRIESIERVVSGDDGVRQDNLGVHREWAELPLGKWSTSDQSVDMLRSFSPADYLLLAYSPPASSVGSCHHIEVKATRHNATLVYRHEYCNVYHSSSDPLHATVQAKTLEQYIASRIEGGVHPRARTVYFYIGSERSRVETDIEFPLDEVRPTKWSEWALPFDLLIAAQAKDGTLVAQRSDSWQLPDPLLQPQSVDEAAAKQTPTRYAAQMDLPPGEYRISIAVSHGPKFGTTEVPLTIDDYDGKELGISSIVLCKRVRKAGDKPVASGFVPLVSNGYEFTPAADTVFHKSESPMVYFELYESNPSTPQPNSIVPAHTAHSSMQFQVRVTNAATGRVEMKTEMNASQWTQPGKPTIPIALKPQLDKLAPGKYRLEVQAFDSAGRRTVWRAAEFSIE